MGPHRIALQIGIDKNTTEMENLTPFAMEIFRHRARKGHEKLCLRVREA